MLLGRSTKMAIVLIVGLAMALIIAVTTLQSASAQDSKDSVPKGPGMGKIPTTSKGEVKLSQKERADFAKKAKQVAGLNEAQISQAIKNPRLFAGTPTSVEPDVTRAGNKSGSLSLSRASGARGCDTLRKGINYNNLFGTRLYRFQINKRWCWNGRRVTAIKFVTDRSYVTSFGSLVTGWRYRGIKQRQNNYFYALGNYRGGHRTFRRGFFEQCIVLKSGFTCGIRRNRPSTIYRNYGNGYWEWYWSK